jgi:putative glutamine amidotransferase
MTKPRIAFPEPHSGKPEYNARSIPQYADAVAAAGGELVVIPLTATNEEIARIISTCHGALLPGSPADVDPQKFDQPKDPHTNPADPKRDNVDELLLQDAFNMRKPLLGICYGVQSLNVWRSGTLKQHIATSVNHTAGRDVPVAHPVKVSPDSLLGEIARSVNGNEESGNKGNVEIKKDEVAPPLSRSDRVGEITLPVNSSHHQSVDMVGDGLRVVATSPNDQIIEAIELADRSQFVLGVQWHPERGTQSDAFAQAIFQRFISEAAQYQPKKNG